MSRARDLASGGGVEAGEVVPHIIPGVLYPAVAGKGIDGSTTVTSFGTDFAISGYATLKYYYTDIKGSKPIKDPRIGAHFGSQRHSCASIQLLEQETATHGQKVYSIDGREWMRAYGRANAANDDNGHSVQLGNDGTKGTGYLEIVGYFSSVNLKAFTHTSSANTSYVYKIDSGSDSAEQTTFATSVITPLGSRYVDRSSVATIVTGQTLGIHTILIKNHNGATDYLNAYSVELIAQDTSNVNNIQIPSQNVVSFGKKFTVSGTPHYNPFDGLTGAKTLAQLGDYIDTATSLGMVNWKGGTANYHKPFNGGRVVKWVDSSGAIKTSVTMMPPNAQNIGPTASNAVSDAHIIAGTNDDTINFDTTTIANATPLSEVAKTFHWREFGNGSVNGNTTYADASMLATSADIIGYVMDDGLTGFSSEAALIDGTANADFLVSNTKSLYLTFIGTGISFNDVGTAEAGIPDGTYSINLPYGTHIFKYLREDLNNDEIYLDGIKIKDPAGTTGGYFGSKDITFHQPKMPPIPEDAVVIADYMLMADHVVQTSVNNDEISKGVRLCSGSRDHFTDSSGSITSVENRADLQMFGLSNHMSPSSTHGSTVKLPFFGTNAQVWIQDAASAAHTVAVGGVGKTEINHNHSSGDSARDAITIADSEKVTLGMTDITTTVVTGSYRFWATAVASPIHTSSHYQSFETPYLNELVGGDRNMEQTNLVVTPDGKTWDEVTRDVSYIGNVLVSATTDTASTWSSTIILDEWRGINFNSNTASTAYFNKDFAIAYDRLVCLVDGWYRIKKLVGDSTAADYHAISIDASDQYAMVGRMSAANQSSTVEADMFLKRGQNVFFLGQNVLTTKYNKYSIERI